MLKINNNKEYFRATYQISFLTEEAKLDYESLLNSIKNITNENRQVVFENALEDYYHKVSGRIWSKNKQYKNAVKRIKKSGLLLKKS